MINIKLTDEGDIDFSKGYATWLDGVEGVTQHIKIRLYFFKGEWFLDEEDGTPWYQSILGSKFIDIVKLILQKRIEDTPDMIKPLTMFEVTLSSNRKMKIDFEGRTIHGEVSFDGYPILNQ